jgi:hypothetical protein
MPDDSETELLRRAFSLLGRRRSARKTRAARENARLGGRPLGTVLSAETKAKISATKRQKRIPPPDAADTPSRSLPTGN